MIKVKTLVYDYESMIQEQAQAELEELVETPGVLQIITDEHACPGGSVPKSEKELELCAGCEYPLHDPRHFICHAVDSVDPPNHAGMMVAHSDEGDWTAGKPVALLKRLLQATLAGA